MLSNSILSFIKPFYIALFTTQSGIKTFFCAEKIHAKSIFKFEILIPMCNPCKIQTQ